MAARLSDRVTYAYCSGCGGLLTSARQAQRRSEELLPGHIRLNIWHAWCSVAETYTARQGQSDRRN